MQKLKLLDLCSGIGGFSLGLERTGGFETVAFCEIDKFCQKVLKKHWPDVPIYPDLRTMNHEGSIDAISAGYPCQPESVAGKREGKEDDRYIWPFVFNIIKQHRPAWFIGENVAGHISLGLDGVLTDLESANYEVTVFVIPACAINARHQRERVWIVANSKGAEFKGCGCTRTGRSRFTDDGKIISDTISKRRCSGNGGRQDAIHVDPCSKVIRHGNNKQRRSIKPGLGGLVDGISKRLDRHFLIDPGDDGTIPRITEKKRKLRTKRIGACGNAVVPWIPEIIGHAILQSIAQEGNNHE